MPNSPDTPHTLSTGLVVVVFSDQSNIGWLRILRRGFRHCFAIAANDAGWVIMDPLSHRTTLHTLPPLAANELADWYRARGYRAIIVQLHEPPRKPAPFALFTCVEAIKRLLGIHRRAIITPYQLWLFLRNGKKSLT